MLLANIVAGLFGLLLLFTFVGSVFVAFVAIRYCLMNYELWKCSSFSASYKSAAFVFILIYTPSAFFVDESLRRSTLEALAAVPVRFAIVALVCVVGFLGGSLLVTFGYFFWLRKKHTPEPADGPQKETSSMPIAKETNRPLIATIVLMIASAIGAYVGGGGTVQGFLLAFCLNPLVWVAMCCFEFIGSQCCAHCRRQLPNGSVNSPVGTPIWCGQCCNYSRKT